MSSTMEQIESEHPELFALEFGKIAETDFVYTLAYPNINRSAPKLVKMYVTSNFSFFRNYFKTPVRQTRKNQGFFGKELTLSQTSPGFYMSAV